MKILILTQWFAPEPVYIPKTLAEQLVRMGHDVQVLTGFPNYPTGKLEEGYKLGLFRIDEENGIKIIRVPLYPSHNYSSMKRAANYISFALSAATIGMLLARKPDIVFVYYQPSTLFLPVFVMKLLWRVPVVLNIQDVWPEGIVATGMLKSKKALEAINQMERITRRISDHIITISPGFKSLLLQRGVSPDKITVIYNWCDDKVIVPGESCEDIASELGLSNKFIAMYAGNMGRAQALDSILDAAAIMEERWPDLHFIFIGGGVDSQRLEDRAAELSLGNTLFLKRMPTSKVVKYLSLSDVLIVHLKDEPLFRITIPSKTQAYMASGKPVLMAVSGDAASLIEAAGAGLSCEPESPRSIAAAIEVLLEMPEDDLKAMGERGRAYYQENLALDIALEKIVGIFSELIDINNKK